MTRRPKQSKRVELREMREPLSVVFGAMVPPLHTQLGTLSSTVAQEQWDADAITRLRVRGLLTEAEGHKARQRLMKRIERVVRCASR